MQYYRRIHDPKEGELVQYLAVYVLNWNKALQPTDAFVEVNDPLIKAAPLMLEALKALIGALGLRRPKSELVEDYGMLGLDAIQRSWAAIAAAEPDSYQDEPSHAFTGEVSNIKTYPKVLSPEETLEEFEKGKVE